MLILSLMLSFAICFAALPAVMGLSWRIGAVDVPRDWRRMHRKSTPRAGGIAIFLALLLSCTALFWQSNVIRRVVGAGILILLLGVCDDIVSLDAWVKLFFQVAVAIAVVLAMGITGVGRLVWATLWVILLSNAHNMIDGMDGLFAGCASIEGIALTGVLWTLGFCTHAYASISLVGGCLAFLCFNYHPAKIFAGDCGSGTVGFLLGLLSLPLLIEGGGGGNFATALLMFAYPLTDLIAAVLRRLLRGQSPFAADRAHLHHRVFATGISTRSCVWIFWLLTIALSTLGVLLIDLRLLPLASVFSMGSAILLMALRRFILKIS